MSDDTASLTQVKAQNYDSPSTSQDGADLSSYSPGRKQSDEIASIQVLDMSSTVETPSPIESSSDNHKLKNGTHFSTSQNSLFASRLPGQASVSLL